MRLTLYLLFSLSLVTLTGPDNAIAAHGCDVLLNSIENLRLNADREQLVSDKIEELLNRAPKEQHDRMLSIIRDTEFETRDDLVMAMVVSDWSRLPQEPFKFKFNILLEDNVLFYPILVHELSHLSRHILLTPESPDRLSTSFLRDDEKQAILDERDIVLKIFSQNYLNMIQKKLDQFLKNNSSQWKKFGLLDSANKVNLAGGDNINSGSTKDAKTAYASAYSYAFFSILIERYSIMLRSDPTDEFVDQIISTAHYEEFWAAVEKSKKVLEEAKKVVERLSKEKAKLERKAHIREMVFKKVIPVSVGVGSGLFWLYILLK